MEQHNEFRNVNDELLNFCGTYYWYQHPSGKLFTDGIGKLRTRYNCFWLVDEILYSAARIKEPFQCWIFKRELSEMNNEEKPNKFTLTCDDGNGNVVFSRKFAYRDFEGDVLRLYCFDNVLMLPSEY